MKAIGYMIKCLTDLHMGSGDVNYSVVDLEVERDSVTEEPTMNASGVKGALRDHCAGLGLNNVKDIFGDADRQGSAKFFAGDLLGRPVRVSEGNGAYVLATSREVISQYYRKAVSLGVALPAYDLPDESTGWICGNANVRKVEGKQVTARSAGQCTLLDQLLGGDNWVLMPHTNLKKLKLPVLAHNVLENKKSRNLWYEEMVPHESVFGTIIMVQEDDARLEEYLEKNPLVQFGAGASTGNGYTIMKTL